MEALERTDRLIEVARMMRAMKTPHTTLIWALKAIIEQKKGAIGVEDSESAYGLDYQNLSHQRGVIFSQ
jgi:hypothetical protein